MWRILFNGKKMDRGTNSSENQDFGSCVLSITSRYVFTAWFTAYLLLLPIFLLVLYIGFNKWKKPQSSASGGLSHSDVFSLHMVAMELISIIGSCVTLFGFSILDVLLWSVGGNAVVTTTSGQVLFHTLTCVERYLAVVHPVTYMKLRREGGVTVRNISIAVVWVISLGYSVILIILNESTLYGILIFVVSVASLPVVAYCSIYVLCVLSRPKPGERGGPQKQIDQSKRTTIYTVSAILGALLLRMIAFVLNCSILFWVWDKVDACAVVTATFWPALPSSLVLPLLFLHRAGKLVKQRKTSG